MATRQALVPGSVYINETESPANKEALVPGMVYVNETAEAAAGHQHIKVIYPAISKLQGKVG